MTLRINSTAESADGTSFSPADDFTVQAQFDPASKAVVQIEAQADATAPWLRIGVMTRATHPPLMTFRKVPFVRITMRGNTAGLTVKAWTDA
ncbi:hypothetical protein [Rhizobium sp. CSW-27]|uniref:hypothetical protein n=1 Tax=Rhizobium sp. CSW-27 TaxID=2839985 RepID=UPI001C019534|nr:hypothetical protein [Rhizobium sp. CSW-27]MBT9370265.1 hypothetical protein [Rhizobium sp. CSW-27]